MPGVGCIRAAAEQAGPPQTLHITHLAVLWDVMLSLSGRELFPSRITRRSEEDLGEGKGSCAMQGMIPLGYIKGLSQF